MLNLGMFEKMVTCCFCLIRLISVCSVDFFNKWFISHSRDERISTPSSVSSSNRSAEPKSSKHRGENAYLSHVALRKELLSRFLNIFVIPPQSTFDFIKAFSSSKQKTSTVFSICPSSSPHGYDERKRQISGISM